MLPIYAMYSLYPALYIVWDAIICSHQRELGKNDVLLFVWEHTLTPHTKINSKSLYDLNIKHDTIKLLEENIDKAFSDINHTNVFLGHSLKAILIKTKINKWDLIKLTSFCTSKEIIKQIIQLNNNNSNKNPVGK